MLSSAAGKQLARVVLLGIALAASVFFLLRGSGAKASAQAAEQRLEAAELERDAVATHAAVASARAAEARTSSKPALARAESLRSRVQVERAGLLRVQDTGAGEGTLVRVPPLVTERIQADSAAISALSLALMRDAQAATAQQAVLVADAHVHDMARLTITEFQHERGPRCGRRCGMLLGAASIVALGIAVDQTRRLLYR